MKKYIIGVIAAAAIAFGVWYFVSPGYALSNMRDAAVEGDADKLEQYIDFASLRESMKAQLKAKMMVEMAKDDNPLGGLGMAIGMGMIDPMIDGMMTPEGMRAMMLQKSADQLASGEAIDEVEAPEWNIERVSFSEIRAYPKTENPDEEKAAMIFKRDGLSWRLSEIDLSEIPMGE